MNEIGGLLKETREASGVSLEEASNDLEINTLILENIEDGNIGCFKDIFVLGFSAGGHLAGTGHG